MNELVDFLRARLDEDEAVARGGNRGPWKIERWDAIGGPAAHVLMPLGDGAQTGLTRSALLGTQDAETMEHIARWDPARVLAEVEAKRRMLKVWPDPTGQWTGSQADAARTVKKRLLMLLALPYAEHPDYRQEWRS